MEEDKNLITVKRIVQNGIVAALYYGLTMLFMLVPVISQFGPLQCRFSELLVLLAFFKPSLIPGLTLGCFLANMTGTLMGQTIAFDMLFGTLATLIACLLEAYFSRFLFVAALWVSLVNGVIVGLEIYYLMEGVEMNVFACMGFVTLGELITMVVGYVIFMIILRNRGAVKIIGLENTKTSNSEIPASA